MRSQVQRETLLENAIRLADIIKHQRFNWNFFFQPRNMTRHSLLHNSYFSLQNSSENFLNFSAFTARIPLDNLIFASVKKLKENMNV